MNTRFESLTGEGLMRWDFPKAETVEHVAFLRRAVAQFGEAYKGVSDENALADLRAFLSSPKAKRYLERKAVWAAYWERGAAGRAARAHDAECEAAAMAVLAERAAA